MKYIKLTQGKFAIVDDSDFEWLSQWKWCYSTKGYAVRGIRNRKENWTKIIWMHKEINQTLKGFDTDHIDRNKLNNQKSNLRTVTRRQNNINSGLPKNNTSGYKGVSWDKQTSKWVVRIKSKDKYLSLGYYLKLQEAILSRKEGERIYFENSI